MFLFGGTPVTRFRERIIFHNCYLLERKATEKLQTALTVRNVPTKDLPLRIKVFKIKNHLLIYFLELSQ